MGFLNNYGVGANQAVENFMKYYYMGDRSRREWAEQETTEKHRKMQEQLMEQQVDQLKRQKEQEAGTSQYIQQALAPQPVGPTPKQQAIGRVQGLMQPSPLQVESPSAGLAAALEGRMQPGLSPQAAINRVTGEERGGAFPQQMAVPKLDIKTFLMKLAEKNPDKAEKYMTALAGLERTDMTDLAKMLMLRDTLGSKEKISDKQIESKEKVAEGRDRVLELIAGMRAGDKQEIAATKRQDLYIKETYSKDTVTSNLDSLIAATTEIYNHPGLPGITGMRGAIPNIPGSAAASAQAKMDSLKAKNFVTNLQSMREASKTGGAVGQVSDAEGKRFENLIGALDKAQSFEEQRRELKKIIQYGVDAKKRLEKAYDMKWGDKKDAAPTTTVPQPAIDYLKKNPNTAAFFDMKYGKGMSKQYLGGQ